MIMGRTGLALGSLVLLGLAWAVIDFTPDMIGWLQPEARAGAATIRVMTGAVAGTLVLVALQWLWTMLRPGAAALATARLAALLPLGLGGLMLAFVGIEYEPAYVPLAASVAARSGSFALSRRLERASVVADEG